MASADTVTDTALYPGFATKFEMFEELYHILDGMNPSDLRHWYYRFGNTNLGLVGNPTITVSQFETAILNPST